MRRRWTALALTLALPVACAAGEQIEGWPVSEAEYDRERLAALDRAIADDTYRDINAIVVIRDGELLIERYYNGADRSRTHDPRSVGKTFASAVLGIALRDGHIDSIDQTLGEFYALDTYANPSKKKAAVTLRHLVTMTSGFEGNDSDPRSAGNEEGMYPQPDWVRWTLDLPMADDRAPGDQWRYFTAGVVLLGDVLNRRVPGGLESYADRVLFEPLGVRNYQWQHTPQRVANTAGGIRLTPLGFARFGELYRRGGRWEGRQIVPADWVSASLTPSVDTIQPPNRYGYLWWHKSYEVDDASWPVAYCTGNGGNKIFVFDDRPLVVVVTASAYGRRYAHPQVDEMMERFILPAIAPTL